MRSDVAERLSRSLVVRGAMAVALCLSLILGSLILGSMGAGSAASAAGPASVFQGSAFYGYVFTDTPGALPERMRAVGPAGAVCGSADIVRISDSIGFYALSVVSADLKRGCPPRNGVVQFSLLSGRVDDGVWADQVATLVASEAPRLLILRAAPSILPNWLGAPGNVDGGSVLRWTGGYASVAEVSAALPFAAGGVYRLDPTRGIFVEVTPSTDEVLTPGDLLFVRFR